MYEPAAMTGADGRCVVGVAAEGRVVVTVFTPEQTFGEPRNKVPEYPPHLVEREIIVEREGTLDFLVEAEWRIMVASVAGGSSAEAAGLKRGDIVERWGKRVPPRDETVCAASAVPVEVEVRRGDDMVAATVPAGEHGLEFDRVLFERGGD